MGQGEEEDVALISQLESRTIGEGQVDETSKLRVNITDSTTIVLT